MKIAKTILLSVGVMSAASAALLLLLALIFGKSGSLPKGAVPIITTLIGCIATFFGGFSASLYTKEKGILIGLASGGVFLIIVAMVSLFSYENTLGIASIGKAAAILLSGAIGGILGVNRKTRVKF